MNQRGRHCTADAYLTYWPGDDVLIVACERAIESSGMNVVACTHKRFKPHGMTAVWILAESHFTIHTYPEHRYISIDCYTCGDEGRPDVAIGTLLQGLSVSKSMERDYERGVL